MAVFGGLFLLIKCLYPMVFLFQMTSDHWQSVQTDDIVLRTWEVESAHNYENSMHFTQVCNQVSSKIQITQD